MYGDVVNDHGSYTVTLDSNAPQTFSGISGCGGAFAKACEKTNTLAYYAGSLNSAEHTLVIRNIGGVNNSYFGTISLSYPDCWRNRLKINSECATFRLRCYCVYYSLGILVLFTFSVVLRLAFYLGFNVRINYISYHNII